MRPYASTITRRLVPSPGCGQGGGRLQAHRSTSDNAAATGLHHADVGPEAIVVDEPAHHRTDSCVYRRRVHHSADDHAQPGPLQAPVHARKTPASRPRGCCRVPAHDRMGTFLTGVATCLTGRPFHTPTRGLCPHPEFIWPRHFASLSAAQADLPRVIPEPVEVRRIRIYIVGQVPQLTGTSPG